MSLSLFIFLACALSAQANTVQLRQKFKDTLLVVKINYLPYNTTFTDPTDPTWNATTIDVLRMHYSFYGHLFPQQVVYLPWNESEFAHFEENNAAFYRLQGRFIRSASIDSTDGMLIYKTLVHAMSIMSSYGGYFFKHEDMAINMPALLPLDKNSIWSQQYTMTDLGAKFENASSHPWYWWNSEYGTSALKNLLDANDNFGKRVKECTGDKHVWASGFSDFLYVPASAVDNFRLIMPMFAKARVFLEIATPMFVECFHTGTRVALSGTYRGGAERLATDGLRELCLVQGENATLCHPIMLYSGSEAETVMWIKTNVTINGDLY